MTVQAGLCQTGLVGNPGDRFSDVVAQFSHGETSHFFPKVCVVSSIHKTCLAFIYSGKNWVKFEPRQLSRENRIFAYVKSKVQISCAVTAQLISAFFFCFCFMESTIPLILKSAISNF